MAHPQRQLAVAMLRQQLTHLLIISQDGAQCHSSVASPFLQLLQLCLHALHPAGRAGGLGDRGGVTSGGGAEIAVAPPLCFEAPESGNHLSCS